MRTNSNILGRDFSFTLEECMDMPVATKSSNYFAGIEFSFKIDKLLKKYDADKENFKDKINGKEGIVDSLFMTVTAKLSLLMPSDVTVTITSNSLYFTLLFDNNVRINFEVLYNKTSDNVQVFYTIYENKEIIVSDYGNIDSCIMDIKNSISPDEDDYIIKCQGLYALPKVSEKKSPSYYDLVFS